MPDDAVEECPICGSPFGDDAATRDQRLDVTLCVTCAAGYDEGIVDIENVSDLQ